MKTAIHMIITLFVIGSLSGGFLSYIANWASPKIIQHRQEDTEKAIYTVQPKCKKTEKVKAAFELYRVFSESGDTLGYAMPVEGNGFQGKVRLMIGVTKDATELTGLEILEQSETPGLGQKIVEEDFKKQFANLVTNPLVEWIKGSAPEKKNQIQTITGATISSKSVVEIINTGLETLRTSLNDGGIK